MNKKPTGIRLPEELIRRIDQLSENSEPHLTKAAIIEHCLKTGLPELEKKYGIQDNN